MDTNLDREQKTCIFCDFLYVLGIITFCLLIALALFYPILKLRDHCIMREKKRQEVKSKEMKK